MECTARWIDGGMSFLAETGSNHAVLMAGAPEAGGRTAFDVVMILAKGRHAITGCEVNLKAERAETDPKVFTMIHFHYRVSGKGLNPDGVERAIKLSKDKYCSASIMLAEVAEITHDFEIIEAP